MQGRLICQRAGCGELGERWVAVDPPTRVLLNQVHTVLIVQRIKRARVRHLIRILLVMYLHEVRWIAAHLFYVCIM